MGSPNLVEKKLKCIEVIDFKHHNKHFKLRCKECNMLLLTLNSMNTHLSNEKHDKKMH